MGCYIVGLVHIAYIARSEYGQLSYWACPVLEMNLNRNHKHNIGNIPHILHGKWRSKSHKWSPSFVWSVKYWIVSQLNRSAVTAAYSIIFTAIGLYFYTPWSGNLLSYPGERLLWTAVTPVTQFIRPKSLFRYTAKVIAVKITQNSKCGNLLKLWYEFWEFYALITRAKLEDKVI